MNNGFGRLYYHLMRNSYDSCKKKLNKNAVNILYWNRKDNLGDSICPMIIKWLLDQRNISMDLEINATKRLLSIGSVVDLGKYDATIWGSGLQSFQSVIDTSKRCKYRTLDIRAVRGPLTRQALLASGYNCPEIYGDPGIILPLIYPAKNHISDSSEIYEYGLINHHTKQYDSIDPFQINIQTKDYETFVNRIKKCKKIISSSLHGIIFAESYGIPSIFLCDELGNEILKYYDWYFSTNRYSVRVARTIEEAIDMEPMELPKLDGIRARLIDAFPYDLWK